jgi:hypothetical protein
MKAKQRDTYRWELVNEAGEVEDDGIKFAWNSAIRAGEDALRDVPGRGAFMRDGKPDLVTVGDGPFRKHVSYAQRWTGPRGTYTVKVRQL